MTFKSVKVKSIDDKSPYIYPSRTLEIVLSKTITTPNRAATLTEYNYKSDIPAPTAIENEISLSVTKLNAARLDSFLSQNGAYKRIKQNIVSANASMQYSALKIHIIEPTVSPSKQIIEGKEVVTESAISYFKSKPEKRDQFFRQLIKMHSELKSEVIPIPYLDLPLSEYETFSKSITKTLHEINLEPFFVFDLAYQKQPAKLEQLLSHFINKADIRLLGFRHKAYQNYPVSYDVLSRYARKDVAFFSIDVPREEANSLAAMHELPFLGNDVYAVESPKWYPLKIGEGGKGSTRADGAVKFEYSKERIKFFNPASLLIEQSKARLSDPKAVLAEIHELGNKSLENILGDYPIINKEQDKLKVLRAFSKVHELKSSTTEFGLVRKRIAAKESLDYIHEHEHLDKTLEGLKERHSK